MAEHIVLHETFTIHDLEEGIHSFRDAVSTCREMVIDGTNVKDIDTAALQLLVAIKKECLERGKRWALTPSDEMRALQSATGIEL